MDGNICIGLKKKGTSNVAKSRNYTSDEIDVIIAYVDVIDCIVWIDVSIIDDKTQISLRYKQARNGNSKPCHFLKDHLWLPTDEEIARVDDLMNQPVKPVKGNRNPRPQSRKVVRPSSSELQTLISTMSYEAIGQKYGVSGVSIKKWVNAYGLNPPPYRKGLPR